jgi:hypothetical protein
MTWHSLGCILQKLWLCPAGTGREIQSISGRPIQGVIQVCGLRGCFLLWASTAEPKRPLKAFESADHV